MRFVGLEKSVKLLIPMTNDMRELLKDQHTASADAQMHRHLYIAYRALANKASKTLGSAQ